MTEKIRLLFLAANPVEVFRLRLGEEFRLIDREIRSSPSGHLFEALSAWAVKPEDLFDLLLIHRPTILHFSGHATKAKGIVLENAAGKMNAVNAQALAEVFRPFSSSVHMIFLNMCHTESYVDELSPFIDCVIGFEKKINDRGAITFSTSFYKALAWGFPVQIAFRIAQSQMLLRRHRYRGSPILKMKDGYPRALLQDGISTRPLTRSTDQYDYGDFKSQHEEIVEIRKEVSALRSDLQQLIGIFAHRDPK